MLKNIFAGLVLLGASVSAHASIVDVDLSRPLGLNQITLGKAVDVGLKDGKWESRSEGNVWVYDVEVPRASMIAVSLRVVLPENAQVRTIAKDGSARSYGVESVSDGVLNTLPLNGDKLRIEVVVPASSALTQFKIATVYAGKEDVTAKSTSSSAKAAAVFTPPLANYMCEIGADTMRNSRSTVGLVVSTSTGQVSCSGTLVNDASNTGGNKIMTAAHCSDGAVNSDGSLKSGSGVTAYWNATSNCAAGLVSFGSVNAVTSSQYNSLAVIKEVKSKANNAGAEPTDGAGVGTGETISDGDIWLIGSASAPPVGASPVWSGVNATDFADANHGTGQYLSVAEVPFVYAISHPRALTQSVARFNNSDTNGQYYQLRNGLSCFGGDFDCLASYAFFYDARFYSVREGSSGSSLRDKDGLPIGVLSACGDENEKIPSGSPGAGNGVHFCAYAKVASAWKGNRNGGASLQPHLDPANSTRVISEFVNPARTDNLGVLFSSFQQDVAAGGTLNVKYVLDNAASCTKSASPALSGWDGAVTVVNGSVVSENVTIPSAQRFTLSLACTNPEGFSRTSSVVVNPVTDPAPVARITFSCNSLSCTFNGNGSTDNGSIVSYNWNFGDGGSASGSSVSHSYTASNSYTVTLSVTDNSGNVSTATQVVAVSITGNSGGSGGSSGNGSSSGGGGAAGVVFMTMIGGIYYWQRRKKVVVE